ncbi:MAG: GerMN domain-containing protein [Candidatus Hydrogenedentes bacterium]|nr:GerMN domain-containing protein [Candidatus Hydrogenedentota bacterium]
MGQPQRPTFFRKAGLAAWALFTLILLFCVLLLANELLKSGKNPLDLSAIEEEQGGDEPGPVAVSQLGNAYIYAVSGDGAMLVPELRSIPLGEFTVENCRAALDELKKPTQGGTNLPVLPVSAECNAMYLLSGGELVVDFSTSLQLGVPRSAGAEAILVYGVVNTLTQQSLKGGKSDAVKTVRFLIDGAVPRETFPAHLDLSRPVAPDAQWNTKTEAAQ